MQRTFNIKKLRHTKYFQLYFSCNYLTGKDQIWYGDMSRLGRCESWWESGSKADLSWKSCAWGSLTQNLEAESNYEVYPCGLRCLKKVTPPWAPTRPKGCSVTWDKWQLDSLDALLSGHRQSTASSPHLDWMALLFLSHLEHKLLINCKDECFR